MKDRETGANKAFAFATFMTKEDAEKAIALLSGKELKVMCRYMILVCR